MSIRTPGSLLCGHCQRQLAALTCAGCKLQICVECTYAWDLCEHPVAVQLALGAGHRLTAIDPAGVRALVQQKRRRGARHNRSTDRIIDLRTVGRETALPWPTRAAQLTGRGQLLTVHTAPVTALGRRRWRTPGGLVLDQSHRDALDLSERQPTARLLCQYDLHTGHTREIHYHPAGPTGYDPERRIRVSCRRAQSDLCLTDLATGTLRTMATAPSDVITAVAYDPAPGLLAAGCWGQIYLFVERNQSVGPARHIAIADSDIHWLASAHRRVVAACHRTRSDFIAVVDIPERAPPGPVRTVPVPTPGLTDFRSPCMALSPDGCYLALALRDHSVAVVQLPAPEATLDLSASDPWPVRLATLPGHTSAIRLLAFARAGALLISADDSGRVIIRPRRDHPGVGARYATEVVAVSR